MFGTWMFESAFLRVLRIKLDGILIGKEEGFKSLSYL